METLRYVRVLRTQNVRKMNFVCIIARTLDADYSICHAIEEQNSEEDAALLLGGLPEVR